MVALFFGFLGFVLVVALFFGFLGFVLVVALFFGFLGFVLVVAFLFGFLGFVLVVASLTVVGALERERDGLHAVGELEDRDAGLGDGFERVLEALLELQAVGHH